MMPINYSPRKNSMTPLIPQVGEAPDTSLFSVLGAGFGLENDMVNAYEFLTTPVFPYDPDFDVAATTKNSPYWGTPLQDTFARARSQEEWTFIHEKIERETRQKEILEAAGAGGVAAAMFAGLISPTSLLPALTPYRGVKGVASAAGLGVLAAGLQEAPLQANQETRSQLESVLSIGAGAFVGGVMGIGAAGIRRLKASTALRKIELDMAKLQSDKAISPSERLSFSPRFTRVNPTTNEVIDIPAAVVQRPSNAGTILVGESVAMREALPDTLVIKEVTQDVMGTNIDDAIEPPSAEIARQQAIEEGAQAIEYIARDGTKVLELLDEEVMPLADEAVDIMQDGEFISTPRSVGAAAVPTADAGLIQDAAVVKVVAAGNPVVRVAAQNLFPTARRMMMKLSSGGLRFAGNKDFIAAAPGGNVEHLVGAYHGYNYKLIRILDSHYTEYLLGTHKPKVGAESVATLRSTFRATGGKMTKEEFHKEVSRAMFETAHTEPSVEAAAKLLNSEIYEPILRRAQEAGLFDEFNGEDLGYLKRQYSPSRIASNPEGFKAILREHISGQLLDLANSSAERFRAQHKALEEYLDDINADEATIAERKFTFTKRLEELGESEDEILLKAARREARAIRAAKKKASFPESEELATKLEAVEAEIKTLAEATNATAAEKRGLRRRLRNLDRSYFAVEEKRAKELTRITKIEDEALSSLQRIVRRSKRLQRDIDKIDQKKLEREYDLISKQVQNLGDDLDKRMARLGTVKEEGLEKLKDLIARTEAQLERAFNRADAAEDKLFGREQTLVELEAVVENLIEAQNALNLKRGERIGKLKDKVKKLTPEEVEAKVTAAVDKQRALDVDLFERMREKGIIDFVPETGEANVEEVTEQIVEDIFNKIMKFNHGVSGMQLLTEERGSSLARMLNINSTESGLFNYLEPDVAKVTNNYIRQVAADIELKRAFGDVNAKQWFDDLNTEYHQVVAVAEKRGATPKELRKIKDEYETLRRILEATISRLRHTWGIPANPDGLAARAGKVILDLNTLRSMGSVAVSSIADAARPVFKHGFTRTIGTGFLPLIKGFKTFKMSAEQMRAMGLAVDAFTHSRAMAMNDVIDEFVGGTVPEKLIHGAASKIGVIALFDYWNAAMKQFGNVVQLTHMMDDLRVIMEGGSNKAVKEAQTRLAELNINAEYAQRIWDSMRNDGGEFIDGIWLPNAETWADKDAADALRAALHQADSNLIITPGLELPLVMNSSIGARMIFQFKSFMMASMSKTVAAGIQQRDMAVFTGATLSVALGMLSYYIYAMTVGGATQAAMEAAGLDKWLDEGIARSGLTGWITEVQAVAQRTPGLADKVSFSGEQTTRRVQGGLVDIIAGPTFGGAKKLEYVLQNIDDPTKNTVKQAADLLPFQNVFYLRRIFDAVAEAAAANLPERRN